jgi:predicted RNase H-like HicB family nuclease
MDKVMNYPIVIHKDKDSDYGVVVPDLPGCFSAGKTLDEALVMAKEAIELHLEGLVEEGQPVPEPGRIEDYRSRSDLKGGIWATVSIDPSNLRLKAKRINITVPERVLDGLDRFAKERKETRSGLLVKAAVAYIAHQSSHAKKRRPPRASSRKGKRHRRKTPA